MTVTPVLSFYLLPRMKSLDHGDTRLLAWLKPDLVWFPAQWPETYSYTLSAVLQAGLPLVAPDIGAFGERVVGRTWSWIQDWDHDAKEWVRFFQQIRADHFEKAEVQSVESTQAAALEASKADAWSYRSDYFNNMSAPAEPAVQAPKLEREYMTQFVPERALTGATKSGLLELLVYLRSMPLLSGIAHRIPPQFQRQVKTWLNG